MSQRKENQFDLTIRDRLNFPYLLGLQVETFQKSILNKDFSRREIEESIQGLVNVIPTRWKDKKFKDDLESAKAKVQVDIRPAFAGVRMKKELCEIRKIPIIQETIVIDYFKMLQACIDILDRLGMLSKREYTEAPTGMPFGEEALPEGMNLQEYLASLEEEGGEEQNDEENK
jgi:hypothetical protein